MDKQNINSRFRGCLLGIMEVIVVMMIMINNNKNSFNNNKNSLNNNKNSLNNSMRINIKISSNIIMMNNNNNNNNPNQIMDNTLNINYNRIIII